MPQAAGQVNILIFLVKINFFPMYANFFVIEGKCLYILRPEVGQLDSLGWAGQVSVCVESLR